MGFRQISGVAGYGYTLVLGEQRWACSQARKANTESQLSWLKNDWNQLYPPATQEQFQLLVDNNYAKV